LYSQAGAIAEKKRAFVERLKAEEVCGVGWFLF